MPSQLINFVTLSLSLAMGGKALATHVANPATAASISRRQDGQHHGIATFFFQNGIPGACGVVHSDNDYVVALQTELYANGAHCGQTIAITDTDNGITTTAVVADLCPSCGAQDNVDLSSGLFDVFAGRERGIIPIMWEFM